MPSDSESRIRDGSSWAEFCDALAGAGEVVLRDATPANPFDRAEGFRYLSRLTRGALEAQLECADPSAPVFRRPAHETLKIGADNPDIHYQSAVVSGAHRYRIHGTRGSVAHLGIGSYLGSYGSGARRGQSGYLDASQLEVDSDGRLEIEVGCERHGRGNWLPMQPETELLIVRQTFDDRARERVAELEIECVGGAGPKPVTAETVDRGLAAAAAYVHGTAELFCNWAEGFAKRPNVLPRLDPAVAAAAHGDPNIAYYHGYWELGPDEALLVEATPPACDYWNFQLGNFWMESLDSRYYRIDVNHAGARYEADGSLRLVVAHEDPGVENWLDTAGHARGTMCLRWVGAREHPQPRTRVLPSARLALR